MDLLSCEPVISTPYLPIQASSLFLKLDVAADIISSCNLFQCLTILWLKKYSLLYLVEISICTISKCALSDL